MCSRKMSSKTKGKTTSAFRTGVIALAFLIIGYEAALFVFKASSLAVEAARDKPDTVLVYLDRTAGNQDTVVAVERKMAEHGPAVSRVRNASAKAETFRFNPNTVSLEDLERLGFSQKQAQSIDNYRKKGGKFRRKEDFAKSYVVSEETFERLSDYIDLPKLDINKADSAEFDALPGIGPYFAAKMVEYRRRLGGYSCPEQLMDIRNLDSAKFAGFSDLIMCSEPEPFGFWSISADSLRRHPYVSDYQTAKAIIFFREHNPQSKWTVLELRHAGIINQEQCEKLSRCRLR